MIEVNDLTNKFNDRTAVNGISFQVKEGKADTLDRSAATIKSVG